MLTDHDLVEGVLLCLLISVLIGAVVWAVLHYGFKVPWANVAGALSFLVALALCLLA